MSRWGACGRKRRHDSEDAAQRFINANRRYWREAAWRVYGCDRCRGFHVTSMAAVPMKASPVPSRAELLVKAIRDGNRAIAAAERVHASADALRVAVAAANEELRSLRRAG